MARAVQEEVTSNSTSLPTAGQLSGPAVVNTMKIPLAAVSTLPGWLFTMSAHRNDDSLMDFFRDFGSLSPLTPFVNSSIIPDTSQKIQFFGNGTVTVPLIADSVLE